MGSFGGFRSTGRLILRTVCGRPEWCSKVGVALEFIMIDCPIFEGEFSFQPFFRLLLSTNEFPSPGYSVSPKIEK
jgi:hypothetical protein